MIYFGAVEDTQMGAGIKLSYAGGSLVDENLPVEFDDHDVSQVAKYSWLRYNWLSPSERGCYLDWLASDRSDPSYHASYVLLYFYGLEYRFFLEAQSKEEKQAIVAEVVRLFGIYGADARIRDHFGKFMDVAGLILGTAASMSPVQQYSKEAWMPVLGWRYVLGQRIAQRRPITSDLLLSWYLAEPQTVLWPHLEDNFEEFRALFGLLFSERFPKGIVVEPTGFTMFDSYQAASAGFRVDLSKYIGGVPDVGSRYELRSKVQILAFMAGDMLEKFSRFLRRRPDRRGSVEAHLCLPEPYWARIPCKAVKRLRGWANRVLDSGEQPLASALIEQVEGVAPGKRIYKKQFVVAADALARFAIGLAPDPRFAPRRAKAGERVMLFHLPEGGWVLDKLSDEYRTLLDILAIGSIIARADGDIVNEEYDVLQEVIDASDLPDAEWAMLAANLRWMLEVRLSITSLRQRLKNSSDETRSRVGEIAVAVALADGKVVPAEVRAVVTLCETIGLDTAAVLNKLGPVEPQGPVTVLEATRLGMGFAMPSQLGVDRRVTLDMKRIAALTKETSEVADVLDAVFSEGEAELTPAVQANGGLPGLDSAYTDFLRTLTDRSRWGKIELTTLAKRYKFMAEGVLETINDWSSDQFDELLVEEEEECYELNDAVIEQVKEALAEGVLVAEQL